MKQKTYLKFTPTITPSPAITTAAVICADVVSLIVAFKLGASLWERLRLPAENTFYLEPWPFLFLFVLAYAVAGLYPSVGIRSHEELKRLVSYTTLVHLGLIASAFILRTLTSYSRGAMVTAWLLSLLLVPLGRTIMRDLFASRAWWGVPVLILGTGDGDGAKLLVKRLCEQPSIGLKPVVLVDKYCGAQGTYLGVPIVGPHTLAPRLALSFKVKHAILCVPDMSQSELHELLQQHTTTFPYLILMTSFLESLDLWVTAKDIGGVLGLEIKHNLLFPSAQITKRILDILLTTIGGLLISPILLIIALLIKLDSPGPVLFTQERLGKNGSRFKALKFRSMHVNAEKKLKEILQADQQLKQEYEVFHKLRQDPRVTPVGRILRKYSLDELPQLWNVLIGEMSLVGPRAYMPSECKQMQGHETVILRVLPGITGLWQVRGRNNFSFQQRLSIDIYYVRNWSLSLDVYLLASTFKVVFLSKGAY